MTRFVEAEIDLQALVDNYQSAKKVKPNQRHLAVIKANAYGHGAINVARALMPWVDGFCVASLQEALALRAVGIESPILLLEGFFDTHEYQLVIDNHLWVVIHEGWQLDVISRHLEKPESIWVKLDTGMHRLGFEPHALRSVLQSLLRQGFKQTDIVVMTHFACADLLERKETERQWRALQNALPSSTVDDEKRALNGHDQSPSEQGNQVNWSLCLSAENSAGILGWPCIQSDWARAGIMIYGISPFAPRCLTSIHERELVAHLKPVMTLRSRIIAVRNIKAGEAVGYGASWVCHQGARIGTVGIGYGDGYPRHASSGTPVLVDGFETQLVGRVSMDMLTVDLTLLPHVGLGSEVVLWGKGLAVERVAESANTIAYELVCCLADRVNFRYISKS